jgi:nicotinamidase-related amidase
MKNLLLVIDYQYDFVNENGNLALGESARKIDNRLAQYISQFAANGGDVCYTLDTHYSKNWMEHPESKLFPMHCEAGTIGHDLYGKTGRILRQIAGGVEKTSYGLSPNEVINFLADYDTITLCGVATDICVLQNAILFYNMANKDTLKLADEFCVGTSKEAHAFAVNYMLNTLGMKRV